jgi:hypothetical protein
LIAQNLENKVKLLHGTINTWNLCTGGQCSVD